MVSVGNRIVTYLSYPMSGYEENNLPKGTLIASNLRKNYPNRIFAVPHEFMHGGSSHQVEGWEHADYIRADLAEIERRKCKAIALVNGWTRSKGCLAEFEWFLARDLRIFIVTPRGSSFLLAPMDGK